MKMTFRQVIFYRGCLWSSSNNWQSTQDMRIMFKVLEKSITYTLHNANEKLETRAGVYETLCPHDMLASKDNLETRCQGQKRGIIQSNIYRNLPKVNQVMYTVHTICVPNIMILSQMLQMFCWHGSIGLKYVGRDNSAKYSQNFAKS